MSWQRPAEDAVTPDPDDPGCRAVVRHEDIVRVGQDNQAFVSRQGVLFDLLPEVFLEMSQSFLARSTSRSNSEHSVCSADTGSTTCARRIAAASPSASADP